tara:strand:+ start:1212 stop:2774 length:1563 start_codon:yes stop_codon:yes gene_type:complete
VSWEAEVEEIKKRKHLAEQMGGEAGIAEQKRRGKLTARERVTKFVDPGTWREISPLVGTATYSENGLELESFLPKGAVKGFAEVDGRQVAVDAGDFTVRGGSGGGSAGGLGGELDTKDRALEWQVPYVRLQDAAGGSVRGFEELGRTYVPDGNINTQRDIQLLRLVPVVSAALGSVAGLPAVETPLSHFSVMVKGISQVFPGGPPVVKAALGYDITKEDLGDHRVHIGISGVVDNLAETEEEAFEIIKTFLSYLPSNVHEMAPRTEPTDDPNRRDESLISAIPRDQRMTYDSHKIIDSVVDTDSFFEIAPKYGRARITGLARINGYPIGIMANNTKIFGGTTDVDAGEKVMRLIRLCDTFHLPLITLTDEPGFMVGIDSERRGIERAGARLVMVTCDSRMPWAQVVMGRMYGVAGQSHHRPTGMFRRWAWPSARWGSMHIQGGTSAAYAREIRESDDPAAKTAEIEARLQAIASPFRTAEATGQDIIDPRDTRPLLVEFVEEAQRVLATQLGPNPNPYSP